MKRSGMRFALVALVLGIVFALPGIARAGQLAANIDQCRNGTFASPAQCIDNTWVNGDLNGQQAHYREDDSVPFRAHVTGLTAGSHTFTAKYRVSGGGNAQFSNRSLIVLPLP